VCDIVHGSGPIALVSAIDPGYCAHLAVLLRSIAKTNRGASIVMHVVHSNVTADLQRRVADAAPTIPVVWHGIVDHDGVRFETLSHVSRATYYRLRIDEILGHEIGRVLYLDADIVVNGDLRPLWATDLGDMVCGAVVDPLVDADVFATTHGLSVGGGYFNAGVLLMDLRRMRCERFLARALTLLADSGSRFRFADQDVLNIVLWQKWKTLDPTWNFQRVFLWDDDAFWRRMAGRPGRQPVILHYTQDLKPWQRTDWHPFAWLYVKHLARTRFRSEIFRANRLTPLLRLRWWLRFEYKTRTAFR
jgi:lipopolysaccharide biosynthesis glycosyltransferase